MRFFRVVRPKDVVEVTIIKNKNDNTYSYVNLTKEHICPCRFNSIKEAINDMNKLKEEGKIIKYDELLFCELKYFSTF